MINSCGFNCMSIFLSISMIVENIVRTIFRIFKQTLFSLWQMFPIYYAIGLGSPRGSIY